MNYQKTACGWKGTVAHAIFSLYGCQCTNVYNNNKWRSREYPAEARYNSNICHEYLLFMHSGFYVVFVVVADDVCLFVLFCFASAVESISLFRNKTNTEIEMTAISRKKVRNTHKYITNKALCLFGLWRKTLSFQRQTNGYSPGKGGRRMNKIRTLTGLRVNEVSSVNNDVQKIRVWRSLRIHNCRLAVFLSR